jgi:hypothetical protein
MAHFVSQPLNHASATPAANRRRRALLTLPDPYDTRYPRPIWLRALRLAARAWWMPLAVYVVQAVTLVAATEQAARFTAPPDGGLVARALRVDWVPTFVIEQPIGLLVVVIGFVALLAALVGGFAAGWWAAADRRRETQVLLVRLARPEERLDAAFVQRALAPALAWQLRTAQVRRRMVGLVMGLVALAVGIALGLGALPPGS